jgi:hypothetical protein
MILMLYTMVELILILCWARNFFLLPLTPAEIVKHDKGLVEISKNDHTLHPSGSKSQEIKLKGGALIAKTSLNAENYIDAALCPTMLCRHVSFSHDHNPIYSNLHPAFTNSLMVGWSQGQLQFKKGRIMRTSPRWIYMSHAVRQVTSCHQLGLRISFGFRRPPWTELATSPSYDIDARCSLMRWKGNDESFLSVLVPPPEDSWIILCVHNKELCHQFWALMVFVSCRTLSPYCGHPSGRPQP